MLFNSLPFLYFFIFVFVVQHFLGTWGTARKIFLLLASYAFYMFWSVPFVLLLVGSIVLDYFVGLALHRNERPRTRKLLIGMSLVVNLGALAFFKYANFIVESAGAVAGLVGVPISTQALNIVLPLGISFYTFQTLSYSIDMYRRERPPCTSMLDFMLYVMFFPQLVAGPIVRSSEFLPQLRKKYRFHSAKFFYGLILLCIGLFKKVLIADRLAPFVEDVYANPAEAGLIMAWAGTIAFAFQIYCDFSGYSDMAIGMARMMGFDFSRNFNLPYLAKGFSDFWRRWHISLSTWLRDYLYISLGGNRRSDLRTLINLMITMLLGGLWHGASWTFVIWGGLHGMYLIVERLLAKSFGRAAFVKSIMSSRLGSMGCVALTFIGVCFAWVFFRADTVAEASTLCQAMLGLKGLGRMSDVPMKALFLMGVIAVAILVQWRKAMDFRFARLSPWLVGATMLALILVLELWGAGQQEFIYFQF